MNAEWISDACSPSLESLWDEWKLTGMSPTWEEFLIDRSQWMEFQLDVINRELTAVKDVKDYSAARNGWIAKGSALSDL